jgi:hypothetical protein
MTLHDLYAKLAGRLAMHLEKQIEAALATQIGLFEGGVPPSEGSVNAFLHVVSPKEPRFKRKPVIFTWCWKTVPILQLVATPRWGWNKKRPERINMELLVLDLPNARNLPPPKGN